MCIQNQYWFNVEHLRDLIPWLEDMRRQLRALSLLPVFSVQHRFHCCLSYTLVPVCWVLGSRFCTSYLCSYLISQYFELCRCFKHTFYQVLKSGATPFWEVDSCCSLCLQILLSPPFHLLDFCFRFRS